MKIQCSCGAKYEFDVTPAMTTNPVKFVCPACGVDASEFVDSLVRQELGQTTTPAGVPQPVVLSGTGTMPARAPQAAPAPAPVPRPVVAVRIHTPEARLAEDVSAGEPPRCSKHPLEFVVDKCYVCSKPICPQCMDVFGYVCSALCKAKAQSHGLNVPVFEGQRSVREAKYWRKVGRIATALGMLVVALIGFWIWFAWFGAVPKPVFSVRFPEPSYSGQSFISGKDQIVFLHGSTLARYETKPKKEIWSRDLIDHKQIAADAAKRLKGIQEAVARMEAEERGSGFKVPSLEKLTQRMDRAAAAELELRVHGQNIWVAWPNKLVRYDWDTGNPGKEITVKSGFSGLIPRGDELLLVETDSGKPVVTHINLNTCETRTESLGGVSLAVVAGTNSSGNAAIDAEVAALAQGQPLDPATVARQAQHLSYPAKLALPAILAANMNQERAMAEMNDQPRRSASPGPSRLGPEDSVSLVPSPDGFVQVGTRLLESRFTARSAMKAAPSKSVLDGNLTAGNTLDAANEVLNEMQRSRGGDLVHEDVSRYQVTLRRPDAEGEWTGEVIGPPTLYPLQTVNVLAANKIILVFDKSNKKLWQSTLNYNVEGDLSALEAGKSPYGQGPCVEHKGELYVFDQGVLSAFDLKTGNVNWRLPTVGVVGLFFDDKDMIYVNTTTASPESIKFSRQIDISQKVSSVVLKIDSRDGRTIWSAEPGGLVNYVAGSFLYTAGYYMPPEDDTDNPFNIPSEDGPPPYLRIRRISPADGHEIWEHFQQRAPLDIQFDKNTIRLVFKKEVQVLRFLTFSK